MAPDIARTAARTSKVRTSVPSSEPKEDADTQQTSLEPERSPSRPILEQNVQNGDQSLSGPEKRSSEAGVDHPHAPIKSPERPNQSAEHSEQSEQVYKAEQSNLTPSNTERSRSSSSPQAYKKRRTITQFEKIEICKKAKDIYLSHKKIADMFGIERTAVTKIVKESDYWLSLKGEDLSTQGMSRIRRTTEDYKRSRGVFEGGGPPPHMPIHPHFHLPPHPQQHIPMGYPPFVPQRCDHQVQIARLQDIVGTLQRYHKGTEDPVERIEKVIESLMQNQ